MRRCRLRILKPFEMPIIKFLFQKGTNMELFSKLPNQIWRDCYKNKNKEQMRSSLLGIALLFTAQYVAAQDTMTYVGKTLSNVDYHHGQLKPVVGTHNIQTFRANRAFPERADGLNFTYNHQPFLAYWNDTYYLQFLS